MKLLQVALLFTVVMLVTHVAASSNRRNAENSVQTEEFQLEIPESCKELGFCEDIPNYPEEQAEKVISELSDLSMFENDKLDLPDITRREGPAEENIELCTAEHKWVYPKAAIDSSGKWHAVLNQNNNPLQTFKVEICKSELYSGVAVFVNGYEARCRQKFIYRKIAVLGSDSSRLYMSLRLPSCCSCVGKMIIS